MDLVSVATRNVVAPAWALWERSPYLRHLKTLRRRQYDPPETVRQRQRRDLARLARHAYDRSPFWRGRFDSVGLRPEAVESPEDWQRLPVLTKRDLRDSAEAMIVEGASREALRRKTTSGSTGVSVAVYVDEDAMQWKRACAIRSDEWSGWRLGERKALVWGNPEYKKRGWRGFLRASLLDREDYLDTVRMDEAAIRSFLEAQRRRRPALLFGHAHSLYLVAQFARREGGAGFRPRGIISTAMVLHDFERRVIEEVFGCPVTNRYGCEEVSLIACECEQHSGLHVNADGVLVEVLRADGSPADPGETGAIVVTDLANRAMPILRYQVGDMGSLSDRRCPCGRGLPILERIEGRVADYVTTPSGDLVSGISLTENFAMLVPGIEQLQIIQEAVDRLVFRIVPAADFGPRSEARIAELVAERFGAGCSYECEYVETIPKEPSGKYRFCISKVPNRFTSPARTEAAPL